jgi:hypothetical protein
MTTQFNFNVCNAYYSKRTLPLYEYYYSIIHDRNDKMCLFGSNQHIDSHIPIIGICDTDDYLSAIDKTLNGILYHYENKTDFDFYFIGDDDTFINFNNYDKFLDLIKDEKRPRLYGSTGPTDHNLIHITGGPGIIINRVAFDIIAPFIKQNKIKDRSFSDVSLALNIHECNKHINKKIEFIEVPEFLNPHKPLTDINKIISYHIRDRYTFDDLYKNKL